MDENWFPKYDKNDSKSRENNWIGEIKKELPDDFYKNRKIGENENLICELIRNDSIKEFIAYINQNNIPLDAEIEPSIYETNNFLNKRQAITKMISDDNSSDYGYHNYYLPLTLIEYSAFFGSIQIFNYLKMNGSKLTNSLCPLAIHSQNAEIIHILEENHIIQDEDKENMLEQSIKFHHNDLVSYCLNNLLDSEEYPSDKLFIQSLKNYNFQFIENNYFGQSSFGLLCKYDYYFVVETLLNNCNIDVNTKFAYHIEKNSPYEKEDDDSNNNEEEKECNNFYNYSGKDFNFEENTPLAAAIQKRNTEIANLLLQQKSIDVNAECKFTTFRNSPSDYMYRITEKKTVFHMAIEQNNDELIKLLLQHKNIDINRHYILMLSTYQHNGDTFDVLEKIDMYDNFSEIWPPNFNDGYIYNNPPFVSECYDYTGGQIHQIKITTLHKSILEKNIEMIKFLLSLENININLKSRKFYQSVWDSGEHTEGYDVTPLYTAVVNNDIEIIKLLIENSSIDCNILNINYEFGEGIDAKKEEISPLYKAVVEGKIDIIKLLLDCEDIDLNLVNKIIDIGGSDCIDNTRWINKIIL